ASARARRHALAVLSRAPLPAAERTRDLREILRTGSPDAAGRRRGADLARRAALASRPAGGRRTAVHERVVAAAASAGGAVRPGTRRSRETRLRAGGEI